MARRLLLLTLVGVHCMGYAGVCEATVLRAGDDDNQEPVLPVLAPEEPVATEDPEQAQAETAAPAEETEEAPTDDPLVEAARVVDGSEPGTSANVSIDHVEAHLQILQQLELMVARSIDEMQENTKGVKHTKKRRKEIEKLSHELYVVKVNSVDVELRLKSAVADHWSYSDAG